MDEFDEHVRGRQTIFAGSGLKSEVKTKGHQNRDEESLLGLYLPATSEEKSVNIAKRSPSPATINSLHIPVRYFIAELRNVPY